MNCCIGLEQMIGLGNIVYCVERPRPIETAAYKAHY